MPHAQFTTAQWDGKSTVTVRGPIRFTADEQQTTEVASLSFVLVQGDVFVQGSGDVEGKGDWGGKALDAEKISGGPARAYGVVVLVRRAPEPVEPVVQTFTWSEPITITR